MNASQNPAKPTVPPGTKPNPLGSRLPPRKALGLFALLFLVNYLLMRFLFPGEQPVTVPYTEFRQQVAAGNVTALYSRGTTIEGRFKQPVTWPTPEEVKQAGQPPRPTTLDRRLLPPPRTSAYFNTELPAFFDRGLEDFLIRHGVEISAVPIQQGGLWTTLLYFGPALLIIGFYVWMYRRAAQGGGVGGMGGMFGIGRSKAKRYDAGDPANRITFNDVAGIDEAEAELVEIVDFLKAPDKYTRLGGTAPKGVLLIGSPGTGKTLLAKAVAGEAGVPFFSMSAAEFVEMIVGVGAARVRDLFKQARESAPAIIFIDEIDAIGRARGGIAFGGGHSEQEQTLQQILTEMDGFSGREGIIVLAATNTPDVLDRALLRPGRFDRRVVVNLPDKAGREAILRVHVRKVPLAGDVRLEELAQATPGFSGADLQNLVNEAALLAARRNEAAVAHKDFLDALEKIVLGPERPLLLSPQDRERIAYHEGGHAILGLVVPGADPVHRVSIVPRGQALGVTYQRPQTDRYNYPEAYLRARIIGMLGGRAAEEVVYGTRTTGAENDIEQATQLARSMVTRWGMSDAVGMVQLAPRENRFLGTAAGVGGDKPFSEQTAALVDAEVQRIIQGCHEEAQRRLREHRPALDALVRALLNQETLSEEEILRVTGLPPAPQLEGAPLRQGT
ncbi:ATP-dependent zinc metalloprotease FtsH [Ramlibacter tataouinensis]|uniref:ATP-dependent zinc metalloprotease FtsH n=1 Tax=Ramlibacter tataouinensis (strain ATCC BAA-407 / DSM 14655 / LMG 21543 / TTB310) TaxID=365046 RepID=F5XVL3_RAMTT|nr:ATP-dependent zinc metalloprotease FtsH [Ramlibacter tataouinensis]AEG91589.1 Candidate ATP-dependent Zn protease [Ramlibacter tataouinensis TTB310]